MLEPLTEYAQEHAITKEEFVSFIASDRIDPKVRLLAVHEIPRADLLEMVLCRISESFPSLDFLLLYDCAPFVDALAKHMRKHPSLYVCVNGEPWEDVEKLRVALGNEVFFRRVVWLNVVPLFIAEEAEWDSSVVKVDKVNPIMERTHIQFGDILASIRRIPTCEDIDSSCCNPQVDDVGEPYDAAYDETDATRTGD